MKTISSQLNTHFGLPCTTISMLWKVKRQDGVILGFTNHDQDITYNDGVDTVTYYAATGLSATATETGSSMGTDTLDVTAFLDSSAITDVDIRAGRYNFADIEIRLVNYKDLTMGDLKVRKGTLGQVKIVNGLFTAEIRGVSFYYSLIIGDTFGPICRADLGDADCTVNMTPLRQTGSVSTSADQRTFVPVAGLTGGSGYFSEGILTWTSGLNNGFLMDIDTWDGTTITLFESMPFAIAPADTFTIEPGCDHTTGLNGCQKFSNIVNMRAEPFIPGQDAVLAYPSAQS